MKLIVLLKKKFKALFLLSILFTAFPGTIHAVALNVDARVVTESDDIYYRRVYGYDMAVGSEGDVHIVYDKPNTGNPTDYVSTTDIVYSWRSKGKWHETILTSAGTHNISTRILVDKSNGVHVCYIKSNELWYQKIINGSIGIPIKVDSGSWHTRMQLDAKEMPMFLRESEIWPEKLSKLALLVTSDGETWDKKNLELPNVKGFRVGNFVYTDGVYHITYGDSAYTGRVIAGFGATEKMDAIFHNLWYAKSSDGVNWSASKVDETGTLYENEFWTSLVVDDGVPLVATYRYAEYDNMFNTGSTTWLAKWNGSGWQHTNITPADYAACREGMGVALAIFAKGDYFGAWDFSPPDTYDDEFRGERGNIALTRFGGEGVLKEKWQVDPFSAEGEVKLHIRDGKIHLLALGDWIDAKLYYREFSIADLEQGVTPTGPGNSKTFYLLPAIKMLLNK